jgi:PAS domain S-box-containing protein
MADVKILLVEDESIESLDIKRTLEYFGYEVPYVASSGEEAVEKALAIMPDLILMDIVLKGDTDGIEAVSKIKDLNIPVIYLTAHSEESTIERAKLTEPYGYIIKPYDRTELKYAIELAIYKNKMKTELKESETKYRTLFNQAADGILLMKGDKFIECNDMALEIYGTTREQLIGKTPYSIFSPEVQPNGEISENRAIEYINKALDGHPQHFEWKHLKYNGTPFYTEISLNRLKIKGQYLLQAIVRDITDRKRVENELEKSYNREQFLADIIFDASVSIGIGYPDGKLGFVNKAFEKLTGYSEEELKTINWNLELTPEKWRLTEQKFLEELQHWKKSVQYEKEYIKKDGSIVPIELVVNAHLDTKGNIDYYFSFITDITKRNKVEDALRISEKNYRTLFEHTGTATIILDENLNIFQVNSEFEKLSGYSKEEIEIKKKWTDFVVKEEQQRLKKYSMLRIKDQKAALPVFETKGKDKNGKIIDVLVTITRIPDTRKFLVSMMNITERKQSEEKFRSLVDNAADALLVHDFNGKLIDVNKRACESLGYSREELLQMNIMDIEQDIDLKPAQKEVWPKIKPNEPFSLFGHLRRKDGTIFPVEVRFAIVDIQGQRLFMGLARDITERLQMQNLLKESEIKYKSLFESNPDYTVFLDPEGKVLDANIAALNALGYNLDDIKGSVLSELGIFPPEDIKIHKEKIFQLFKGENVEPFLARLIDKNGKIHWCQNHLIPIKKEGNLIGYQSISHDITERKIADKALIESQQRLSEIIDFLPDATLAIDVEGKVIAWNRAIEEMTGFKAGNIIGKGNYEYSLPFYGKLRPILIDLVLKRDKKIENYYRFIKREGNALLAETEVKLNDKNFILWVKAVPLYDSDGNINGAIESIRDITQHKLDESALKRSEERFRAVAESAVDAIVTTDANGNIIFFNNSLTKIFGYTKEELTRKPLTLLMPERFKKNYLNELEKFKKSGQHRLMGKTVTTTGLKKDKNEFPFEMSLSAWKSEGKTYFTSIIRDLTERKKAENAELQYQSLFDNMLNGFAYCKMIFKEDRPIDFIYLDVNQAFESLTGLKDVTGKKVSEVIPLIQESDPELLEIYGRVALTGQPETFEMYVESLKMWFSISVYSPRKEFFVAVFDVITERKEAEEKIKSSLKEKEVLLQEIHHRVKNNMQIISSLLNLQTKYVDAEESVNVLMESKNRVKSMAMIHEKLYQSNDLTHIKFVDYIPSLVLNLFYSYKVESTQIEPIFEIEDISLNMETAVPCGLIISELVSNSLKYAFPNGRKGEVHVSLKSEDDKYELIISDNGLGLPEKLDLDNLESLGLRLVNSLTEQIDGEMTINRSHGTEFKITFKELSYKDRI